MKNKNLITISMPRAYFQMMEEAYITRQEIQTQVKKYIEEEYRNRFEKATWEIQIAKTKWIKDDED